MRGYDDAPRRERRREERRLHLSQTFGGTWVGDIVIDPVSGAIVAGAIECIEAELFAEDWAEAERLLGKANVSALALRRTPAQRRADALVEMAVRSGTAPADGRRPEPPLSVLVGYPSEVSASVSSLPASLDVSVRIAN